MRTQPLEIYESKTIAQNHPIKAYQPVSMMEGIEQNPAPISHCREGISS
jgi:hypothetical protein